MKLFNNHSGSRDLPHFIKGIHWATGLFLRTSWSRLVTTGLRLIIPLSHSLAQRQPSLAPLRSFQFAVDDFSVIAKFDARVQLVWTLLRVVFFLRSSCSKFSGCTGAVRPVT